MCIRMLSIHSRYTALWGSHLLIIIDFGNFQCAPAPLAPPRLPERYEYEYKPCRNAGGMTHFFCIFFIYFAILTQL